MLKTASYLGDLRNLRSHTLDRSQGMSLANGGGSQVLKRATPGERVLGSLFPARGTGWPGGWSGDRLEMVQHMRNWTYVAVNTICKKVASITPNLAYVVDSPIPGKTQKAGRRTPGTFGQDVWMSDFDGGHSFLTMGAYRSKALSVVKPHEELEPLESDHPLRRLIENPNPFDTNFDKEYETTMFHHLTGTGYDWNIPNEAGMPVEGWCIPSHWVWPRTGGSRYITPENPDFGRLIEYYEIRPWGGMGSAGMLRIPASEIVATRWKSPLNKIDGYSPLSAIAQWIDSEESITKSRWSQFMNSARPEFWVELGPGYEDPDDDRIARIEAKFAAKIQGEYNYGKPVITPPGAKITPLSFNPSEMAYFQSEEQIRDMILSAFGVPKTAVGIASEMTYGSLLASLAQFCAYCLNPYLAMRGQVQTKFLASRWDEPDYPAWSTPKSYGGHAGRGRKVKYWYDDCVPADPSQVNSDLAEDRANYAITPNEVRALRGRKAWPGGNSPIVSGPGGPMPLPLDQEDGFTDLAKLVGEYTQASQPKPEQPGAGGQGASAGPLALPAPGEEGGKEGEEEGLESELPIPSGEEGGQEEAVEDAGIAKPNGKPSKAIKKGDSFPTDGKCEYGSCNNDATERVRFRNVLGMPTSEAYWYCHSHASNVVTNCPRGDFVDARKDLANRLPEGKADPIKIHLPELNQGVNYSCGASSLQAVCEFFGVGPQTEEGFIEALPSDPESGTDPSKILRLAKEYGLQVEAQSNLTVDDLKRNVDNGNPVIVLIQAWYEEGSTPNFASSDDGHYVVFIGYDEEKLYFADPVIEGARGEMTPEEFMERWHDEGTDGKVYRRYGIAFWRPSYAEPIKSVKCRTGANSGKPGPCPTGISEQASGGSASTNINDYPHMRHLLNNQQIYSAGNDRSAARAEAIRLRDHGIFAGIFEDKNGSPGGNYLVTIPANTPFTMKSAPIADDSDLPRTTDPIDEELWAQCLSLVQS